jgi:hypothetical protein
MQSAPVHEHRALPAPAHNLAWPSAALRTLAVNGREPAAQRVNHREASPVPTGAPTAAMALIGRIARCMDAALSRVLVLRLPARGAFGNEIEEVPDIAEIVTGRERRVFDRQVTAFDIPRVTEAAVDRMVGPRHLRLRL